MAINTLQGLLRQEENLTAENLHGAMRVQEARSIRMNAEIMASAALARTETRTRSAHRRLDYPEADNVNWRSFAVVSQGADGRPEVKALDASLPLSSSFPRNSGTTPARRMDNAASA
jgi:succinate dehydrogenase/fumarate reductase flavoprotein subunit